MDTSSHGSCTEPGIQYVRKVCSATAMALHSQSHLFPIEAIASVLPVSAGDLTLSVMCFSIYFSLTPRENQLIDFPGQYLHQQSSENLKETPSISGQQSEW